MSSHRQNSLLVVAIILVAACARLTQWVPNFAPITALAVFSALTIQSKRLSFLLPLFAMIVGDVLLAVVNSDWSYALHNTQLVVYGTMMLIVALTRSFSSNGVSFSSASISTIGGSVLFFVVTNFAVWVLGTMYTHDLAGLSQCYLMALPFFRNALVADVLYSTLMFAAFALSQRRHIQTA